MEAPGAENINWRGKPKDVTRIGQVDIFVLMGPEVELPPQIEGRVIRWEIPHPGGKGAEEYRRVVQTIKEKIAELIGGVSEND